MFNSLIYSWDSVDFKYHDLDDHAHIWPGKLVFLNLYQHANNQLNLSKIVRADPELQRRIIFGLQTIQLPQTSFFM